MATPTASRLVYPSISLLGLAFTAPHLRPREHYCQPNPSTASSWQSVSATGTSTINILNPATWFRRAAPPPPPPPPPPTATKTTLNPLHYRQISTGSFAGLLTGLLVSKFSKPLALLLGMIVFVIESLALKGIHIIPYRMLGRWIKEAEYKSLILDNVAFKIAFAASFAAAAAL